jgi:hypothetical protein
MEYLPLKADGSVSWDPSPSDVTQQYAIGTVASDWSLTQLQTLSTPLKVVHDASCGAAPTLQLPLDTTVDGTLTVGTHNVGSALTALAATHVLGMRAGSTCIRIITDTGTHADGYIKVVVGTTIVVDGTTNYGVGSTVLDQCYTGFSHMYIQGPTGNAWKGSITASIDAGTTYSGMKCVSNCWGASSETSEISVDLDDNRSTDVESFSNTRCQDGKTCKIVLA